MELEMKSIKSAFDFVGNCVMPKFNKYVGWPMFLFVEMILKRTESLVAKRHQIYCVAW
jgi:hypothetical protein